ncbi:MAG: asparagine--tRNA ligase [Candidatus Aenigmarchaeota archaeon]|nr:asparagine--tRNA ligase [Candidatus Aenigmarchaeota archaeon]
MASEKTKTKTQKQPAAENRAIGQDNFTEIGQVLAGKKTGAVSVRGWLYHKRSSGGLLFLTLRDRTGLLQCTLSRKTDTKLFDGIEKLQDESVLAIDGEAKADSRAPGGYELSVKSADVISAAEPDYPIAKKEHGPEFLMDERHLWLRDPKMQAMLKLRSAVMNIARDWLLKHGYIEFQSPIFMSAACEGGSTLFTVDYFGKPAYLTQSWQLYAEAAIASIGKIFTISPSFRAEKSRTRRHLAEFWHLEVEEPFQDIDGLMKMEEEFVSHICQTVAKECAQELKEFGRDPAELLAVKAPFKRMTYADAIELLKKDGVDVKYGDDLDWEKEKALTLKHKVPFFVYRYPKGIKAFYHMPAPDDPKVTLSADLLAPEGYGELIGGGQRTHDYKALMKRIEEEGLKASDYDWYLDLRKWGTVPHSGFGMGIERLLMWMLKLEHIRDAIPFPRMMNRIAP